MPPPAAHFRRLLLWLVTGGALVFAVLVLLRAPLTGAAVRSGLRRAGAEDVRFDVARATPWEVELEHLAFRFEEQPFAARRVSLLRPHWWRPTLGSVRIAGAQVPVDVARLNRRWQAAAEPAGAAPAGGAPPALPVEELSFDGQVTLKLPDEEQPLAVKFEARPGENAGWSGRMQVTGPGLELAAAATYGPADGRLAFHVTDVALDLGTWRSLIREAAVLPAGTWELAGRLTGAVDGTYAGGKLAAGGHVALRDGHAEWAEKRLVADGVEADFAFTDLPGLRSEPGQVRVRELRVGDFAATEVGLELAFENAGHVAVARAGLRALGGRVTAEPFKFAFGRPELDATVLVDGLEVAQILALAKDVPAEASGQVSGRLPLRLDAGGLRLGTGWLELKQGVYAEVRLRAAGLLTGGMTPAGAGYTVMKRIEDGLLQLHLAELRLDVRPPDVPAGRSARLHLAGEPVDGSVKAPVTLDVNVNGPLEQLINFGLNKNVSFGTKP